MVPPTATCCATEGWHAALDGSRVPLKWGHQDIKNLISRRTPLAYTKLLPPADRILIQTRHEKNGAPRHQKWLNFKTGFFKSTFARVMPSLPYYSPSNAGLTCCVSV